MTALVLDAPAKVNLYLRVLGKLANGYHELETVLHELDLRDTLVAEIAASGTALRIENAATSGFDVAPGNDNLVARAAQAFFTATSIDRGVRFHLTKRIPAGGGLGGGSADAAIALLLLNALFEAPLTPIRLHAVAASLGSDVPFFLQGGTQLGRGTGTDLLPLEGPTLHFVLLLPAVGSSTAAIYKNHRVDLTLAEGLTRIPGDQVPSVEEVAVATGFPNDLEPTALRLQPELAVLRDRVAGLGYPQVRMSGSGSSFFVVCPDEEGAQRTEIALEPLCDDGVTLLRARSHHASRVPHAGVFPDAT